MGSGTEHGRTLRDLSGAVVASYRIAELLGRGGMGEVYRAHDTALGRDVALKVVSGDASEDPEFVARFEREARAASAINHPNVAHIYALGNHEGRPYYVMEFIQGRSLDRLMRDGGRIPPARVIGYLVQACHGLAAAHAKGIIHRDVKPANLMIDEAENLKVVDFGLARRPKEDDTLTTRGQILGTPRYMAPEQALGKAVDHRTDIYSLGATFYHVLAGAPPFEADTPFGVMMKHVNEPLPPLKDRQPALPDSLCAAIEKMLAKEPEDRPRTYGELLSDLAEVRSAWLVEGNEPTVYTPAGATPGTTARPTRSPTRPDRTLRSGSAEARDEARDATARIERTNRILLAAVVAALAIAFTALGVVGWAVRKRPVVTGTSPSARPRPSATAGPAESQSPASELPVAEPSPRPTPVRTPTPRAEAGPSRDVSPTAKPAAAHAPAGHAPGIADGPSPPASASPLPRVPQPPLVPGAAPRLFPIAARGRTLLQMQKICRAVRSYRTVQGRLPAKPEDIASFFGSGEGFQYDAWGNRFRYEVRDGGNGFRLESPGADKALGTDDDIVFENGELVKGGAPGWEQPPEGLAPMAPPPPGHGPRPPEGGPRP